MSKRGWIWLFVFIVVVILTILFFALKGKAQSKNGNGNGGAGTKTNCCGTISTCGGLSSSKVRELQQELNSRGCKDYENKSLIVDGECGPRTNSALKKCK